MKWRSICEFCFCFPPLPQRTQNCSRLRIERAGSCDAPKLILDAFALSGG